MATQAQIPMSLEEYFEFERRSVDRHEYLNGHVHAMAGGTQSHSTIALNVGTELNLQLRGENCNAYNGDMRISTHRAHHYTYADAVVACDPRVENDTLLNPVLIVEVLSKSTEDYDHGKKFERYRRIPSFREYLLIAQKRVSAERHARTGDQRTTWIMTEYTSLDDVIELISIPIRLRLKDLYAKVSFPANLKRQRQR